MTTSQIRRTIHLILASFTTREAIEVLSTFRDGSSEVRQVLMSERNKAMQECSILLCGHDKGQVFRSVAMAHTQEWFIEKTWNGMQNQAGVALNKDVNGLLCKALVMGTGSIPMTDRGICNNL